MANYCEMGRSSYFKVRDLPALLAWAKPRDVGVWHGKEGEQAKDGTELVAVYMNGESWPSAIYTDADEEIEVDVIDELRAHIADGWCVVIEAVGWEKLRYLSGSAWIVTPTAVQYIDLTTEALKLAKATGLRHTAPEY